MTVAVPIRMVFLCFFKQRRPLLHQAALPLLSLASLHSMDAMGTVNAVG